MAKEKFEFYLPTDIDLDTLNIPCTLQICPISTSYTHYLPSLPGNSILLSLFSILFLSNIYLGLKHRKPFFTLPISLALALEIAGHASRIQLHSNPFIRPIYLLNLISLTTAPFLITATTYLYAARLCPDPNPLKSNLHPYRRTILFLIWDIQSLGLQLIGSIIAALSLDLDTIRTATLILTVGCATQVASLVVFIFLLSHSVRRRDPNLATLNPKLFPRLTLSLFLLLARAIFRIVEFSGGWNGELAGDEVIILVEDAGMAWGACGMLTVVLAGGVVGLGRSGVRNEGEEEGKEVDDGEE